MQPIYWYMSRILVSRFFVEETKEAVLLFSSIFMNFGLGVSVLIE